MLPQGDVLVVGGTDQNGQANASTRLYHTATGQWNNGPDLPSARYAHTATQLRDGTVLLAGGRSSTGAPLPAAQAGTTYDPRTGTFTATGPMAVPRSRHTATLLLDGTVLVVGGQGGAGQAALTSVEIYAPAERTWRNASSLPSSGFGKRDHTATLLPDGRVLVVGGISNQETPTTDAYLRDAVTGNWTEVSLNSGANLARHTATLLPDGRVFVAGGEDFGNVPRRETYLFNPQTNRWVSGPTLKVARSRHSAALLPDGRVLLSGGRGADAEGHSVALGASEVLAYGGTITALVDYGAPMHPRWDHGAMLLPGGQVLATGGRTLSNGAEQVLQHAQRFTGWPQAPTSVGAGNEDIGGSRLATLLANGDVLVTGMGSTNTPAWRYQSGAGTWTAAGAPSTGGRRHHTQTLLANGSVLVVGGYLGTDAPLTPVDLYNPGADAWAPAAPAPLGRGFHTATLLPSGDVLVAGGRGSRDDQASPLRQAHIYRPASNTWITTSPMPTARALHSATLLPDGRVMVAGGQGVGGIYLDSVEVYDPATATWAAAPGRLDSARAQHTATLLHSGQVLIAGGRGGSPGVPQGVHVYSPLTGSRHAMFGPDGSSIVPMEGHSATRMPDGRVMLLGGTRGSMAASHLITACDGASVVCTDIGGAPEGMHSHTATLLADGRVLAAGGSRSVTAGRSWLINPDPSIPATRARPAIAGGTTVVGRGAPLSLVGTGLTGDSEASGGGTSQSAANAPLLTVTRLDSGPVYWPGHMGFGPDSYMTDALNPSLPAGLYQARIFTDGIASAAFTFGVGDFASPQPPTGVDTQPGNAQVTVSWIPPATGAPPASYTVAAQPGGETCVALAPATSCVIRNLSNGTRHTFVVTVTAAGGASASANPVTATPNGQGPAPVLNPPRGVQATPGDERVALRWDAPATQPGSVPPVSYTVLVTPPVPGCAVAAPATGCTVTGLANNTAYTFVVRADAAGGLTSHSLPTPPVTPRGAGPDPGSGSVKPVPTLGEWSLALLAALMLLAGLRARSIR